jgi:hypothetical protein
MKARREHKRGQHMLETLGYNALVSIKSIKCELLLNANQACYWSVIKSGQNFFFFYENE